MLIACLYEEYVLVARAPRRQAAPREPCRGLEAAHAALLYQMPPADATHVLLATKVA